MVNKPKKKIVRQQSSADDQIKKRSGKPKGIKQNCLPPSGEWCEDLILKALIILLTMFGRFNNLHKTGTQSKQLEKSDQSTKLKNQIIKNLALICGRRQKSDGTIVFFFNTKFEQQNLDQFCQENNLCGNEINITLIEKLGQMLELSFIQEIIQFIKSGSEQPFQLFQEGGLDKQFQVVQAYFVKWFLEHNRDVQEDINIQLEFQEFKQGVDKDKIIEVYQQIASYFVRQQNQYENETNKMIEHTQYEESQYQGQFNLE